VAAMVIHQPPPRFDFQVLRGVLVIGAIRSVHGVVPVAAGAQVAAVRGQRETARSPPLFDFAGYGPRIPDRFERRVVGAGEADLVVGLICCGHGAGSWFWTGLGGGWGLRRRDAAPLPAGRRGGDPAAPPRQLGTAPSSRWPPAAARH